MPLLDVLSRVIDKERAPETKAAFDVEIECAPESKYELDADVVVECASDIDVDVDANDGGAPMFKA